MAQWIIYGNIDNLLQHYNDFGHVEEKLWWKGVDDYTDLLFNFNYLQKYLSGTI